MRRQPCCRGGTPLASPRLRRSRSLITSSAPGWRATLPHERKRILCAGIVVLDEVFRVKEFPPPDGKIEAIEFMAIGGGNAANAAITIARLGGQASYAGPVGDDAAGDRILANLAREKIDTRGCVRVPGTSSPLSA